MTRKHRILHLIDHLSLGGAQRALLDLITASDRTRFDHEVACLHGKGVEWEVFTQNGIAVHSLSPSKWNPIYLVRLAALLQSGRFDAIHCHLFYSNLLGKPLAAALGVRNRFAHDQWNDPPPTDNATVRILDSVAHLLSTHVFAVSPFIGEYLVEAQGLPADRVSVVPNGVDLARFPLGREYSAEARRKHGLPQNGPVVGAIARLTGQKNLTTFLRAASHVLEKRPDTTFVIAGTGEQEAMLKAEAARLKLGDRCRFLGHVADMPRLYPALDVKILPSVFEGFGLVICEALLCGVAVVASTVAGAKDYLRDGEDCFFVPPHDDATYAARILQLLDDPGLRERQTQSARRVIEAKLSSTAMARAVESVYEHHFSSSAP